MSHESDRSSILTLTVVVEVTMNTMLAPRIGFPLVPRDAWAVAGGVLAFLAAVSLAPDTAYAQDVAAIPAASGETMNSLLGRIAPATLAAAPASPSSTSECSTTNAPPPAAPASTPTAARSSSWGV